MLSYAQDSAVIKGRIYDKSNQPLPGAYVAEEGNTLSTSSNDYGYYLLKVPSDQLLRIYVNYLGTEKRSSIAPLDPGTEYRLDFVLDKDFEFDPIEVRSERYRRIPSVIEVDPKTIEGFPVTGGVEVILKSIGIGISNSGGELSSGYNVRGGNFDENLVYVNDIEVYRPFLVRSGQQEGLSIINTDLVQRITFSAGGFETRYGDKLSSVLDIKYRDPDSAKATISMSMLGANLHFEGASKNRRFSYLTGVRYRSNQYLLNSLDVQGDYKPRFWDIQALLKYRVTSDFYVEWLSTFSQNRYLVVPQSRTTNFGNVNSAIRLFVAFGGQELMQYSTLMNGLSFNYEPSKATKLKLIMSNYYTSEREHFTVEGAYRLDELETNLGADNFADARRNLGFGYFIDNARNDLTANVYSIAHKGTHISDLGVLQWGAGYKHERITDQLKEWRFNDSSGYNINTIADANSKDQIILDEYVKAQIGIVSSRFNAYIQNTNILDHSRDLVATYGLRTNYWTFNQQNVVSPRLQLSYKPNKKFNDTLLSQLGNISDYDSLSKDDWVVKAAFGYYYQPPFYRELRNLNGTINKDLKAQQSIHFVLGGDLNFEAWNRPFKFITEVYYKHLDNMVPYVIDNVRIRYLAENSSQGYAAGFDARVNGEFIEGIESWFNFSLLTTKERIYYTDEEGTRQLSDWLRRPTDQKVNFSILFQDELPSNPSYKMNVNIVFGSKVPFYFDGKRRFAEGFLIPPYRRVDIGFSKVLLDANSEYRPKWLGSAESLWVSLEVFNLLQVNNTISYTLLKDFANNIYGVPNYLTGRRLNLRFILKI